jgi:hypothetical protein
MRDLPFSEVTGIISMKHHLISIVQLAIITTVLTGCSNLLFYPLKTHLHTPDELNLAFEDVMIDTADNEQLHAWWFQSSTSTKPLGTILFLHGNAENISTHFASIAWLPKEGYNVLALDYRGYGLSTGEPDLEGALTDIDAAFNWLMTNKSELAPFIILGQSIGGALTLSFVGNSEVAQSNTKALIIDSGFESFQGIAREKLATFWLTWPLQYPLSWLIPSTYDPIKMIHKIKPVPILYIHSINDQVIPYEHGKKLHEMSMPTATLLTTNAPHISSFMLQSARQSTLEYLHNLNETGDNQITISP